jgi:phosphosulfolactate phosphohydrolase-like enzyme
VGEDSEGIAASSGSENNRLGSGEERDVSICPQEDHCRTAGEMGEVEEGGVDSCDEPRDT